MRAEMLPQCSHMTRKRGVYFFRRRLPLPHVGEIAISLGTRHFRLAEMFCEALDKAFKSFFTKVHMSAFNVTTALRQYLADERAKLHARHLETPPGKRVHGTNIPGVDALTADLQDIEAHIFSLKQSLAKSRFFIKEHEAAVSIGVQEASESQRRELALGMLQAKIQLLEQSKDWLVNGLIPEIAPEAFIAPVSVTPVEAFCESEAGYDPAAGDFPCFQGELRGLRRQEGLASDGA